MHPLSYRTVYPACPTGYVLFVCSVHNTPPQTRQHMPTPMENFLCFSQLSPFIKTSAISVGHWSGTYSSSGSPMSTTHRSNVTPQCASYLGFHHDSYADRLPMNRCVSGPTSWPSSVSRCLSQTASLAACALAMYSASVLDKAMELCFFEL